MLSWALHIWGDYRKGRDESVTLGPICVAEREAGLTAGRTGGWGGLMGKQRILAGGSLQIEVAGCLLEPGWNRLLW